MGVRVALLSLHAKAMGARVAQVPTGGELWRTLAGSWRGRGGGRAGAGRGRGGDGAGTGRAGRGQRGDVLSLRKYVEIMTVHP